jgi:hypothetical protein
LMGDNSFDQLRLRHIFPFFFKQLDQRFKGFSTPRGF